jgi:uncharacterized protein with PIN domain
MAPRAWPCSPPSAGLRPLARTGGRGGGTADAALHRRRAPRATGADVRFAGYDTLWRPDWQDAELAARARAEARIVLTRDRDLLMHTRRRARLPPARRGAGSPARRAGAPARPGPARRPRAGRCLGATSSCSRRKAELAAGLPEGTREHFELFWALLGCGGVFWWRLALGSGCGRRSTRRPASPTPCSARTARTEGQRAARSRRRGMIARRRLAARGVRAPVSAACTRR